MTKKLIGHAIPASELGNPSETEEKAIKMAEELAQAIDDILEDLTQVKQIINVLGYNIEQISYDRERVRTAREMAWDVQALSRYVRGALSGRIIESVPPLYRLFPVIEKEREEWLKRIDERMKNND